MKPSKNQAGARVGSDEAASDLASDLSRKQIGGRLLVARGGDTQEQMAVRMGVYKNTYSRWERGEREPSASDVARLVREGWNANWLLAGEGPERLEAAFQSHSQNLSEANLSIALEYTDDIIRATRATYVPRSLYAKLLGLMYQGVTQGLPVAEIHDIGQQLVRAVISGTGEQGNVSQSGLGRTGTGGS